MDLYEIIALVGKFAQIFGLVLFGVTSGWFTLYVINQPEKNWQLQGIVYGVFFVFISLMVKYLDPGAFGAYLTGTAGALVYWGLIKNREKPEKKK